ncbi:MAG: DEAD/DEAH box helicase [Candidatus Nanopelagicaceae bacterium]|nr:DEAD/DEAH box helicase [Candidatus Nanopelagicaceae bacterium]
MTFASLGVHKNLVSALSNEGIEFPFPIQAATLPEAINGRDVLGRGQTGSGKTLAFGLTVLTRLAFEKPMPGAPYALILAPTRELAMQIDDVLATYADEVGLRSTVLAGGMPYPPQLQALRKGVQIVVATPGRLQDHMKKGTIDLSATEIVVLDEADQMADMGFLPVVTEVLAQTPQDGQRLLFSATLDKDVDKLVKKFMKDPVTHSLAVTEQREADMDHHVLVVDSHVKDDVIAQIASREGRTIFFVRTKHGADRLTEKLKKQGVDAGVLHGGRTQKQRMRVLDAFKIGKKRALIATDVAARGIHVDDVSLVVHVDPPETHKDYLHRAGRTARAGAKGTVVSIASSGNRKRVHNLGKEAGVKMTETRIESRDNHLHPELLRITGAQEPSGVPVADEVVTRSERSKPGRKRFDDRNPRREREERPKRDRDERPRAKREERPRAAFEKKRTERKFDDRKPRRDDRPRRDIEDKKPDRDALRRKDRGSKKFDSRLEKRINIREEKPKREERREEKKTVTGPNRIQRRAHLQPADRPVKTRHEKRTKGSSKSKPKRSGKPAARKSGTSARKTTGNRKLKSRSRAGR